MHVRTNEYIRMSTGLCGVQFANCVERIELQMVLRELRYAYAYKIDREPSRKGSWLSS